MDIGKTVKDYYDIGGIGYYYDYSRYEYTTLKGWLNLVELKKEVLIKDKLSKEKILQRALQSKEISEEDLARKDSYEILDKLGIVYEREV